MKAALYCRISTGEQSKFSLDAQEDELRRYCRDRGIEVFKVYKDKRSGLEFEKREALQEMLDDADKKLFDLVLVTEKDRLARDIEVIGYIKLSLKMKGIDLQAVNEPPTKSDYDELIEGVINLFAKFETKRRLRRIQRGREKARKESKFMNRPPLGYKMQNGKLVVDQQKMSLVTQIFKARSRGANTYQIARLTSLPRTSIAYILRNPLYRNQNIAGIPSKKMSSFVLMKEKKQGEFTN